MRIERVRAARTAELGEMDLTLGAGLIGWSGGTPRDRRLFTDLLCWTLGLQGGSRVARAPEEPTSGEPMSGSGPGPERTAEMPEGGPLAGSSGSWGPGDGPRGVEVEVSFHDGAVRLPVGAGISGIGDEAIRNLHNRVGMSPEALAFVWTGGGRTEPEPLWHAGARLLAARRGLTRIEEGLARLDAGSGPADRSGPEEDRGSARGIDPGVEAELAAVKVRLEELADVPERLRSLEAELRSLRADAAEVTGDLEAATMDWLRERQDAETHLQQYRDRARELRARMKELEEKGPEGTCPFCGRPLEDHKEQVLAELREEWDALVQDGSWWRRRRDQLELKPDDLQEMERRAVRLQAEVEDCAERLERCRFELREWDELRGRREELEALVGVGDEFPTSRDGRDGESSGAGGGASVGRRRDALIRAFRRARDDLLREERRRLARSAGSLLNRISGGRILGLVEEDDGRLGVLEDGRVVRGVTVEDRASAALAMHLALTLQVVGAGAPLESLLVGETFRGMDPEARIRSVEVFRGVRDRIPQILLLSGSEVVDAVPERFDHILTFRADRDRPSVRRLPGGVGRLRIVG